METDAVLSREKLARSFVSATMGATFLVAVLFVTSWGTAPIRVYCVSGAISIVALFVAARLRGGKSAHPKGSHRIALEALWWTGAYLSFMVGSDLTTSHRLMPALFYLEQGPFIFLLLCLFGLGERGELARSAKRLEELEKSSLEYEAKRRVEEMKSAP